MGVARRVLNLCANNYLGLSGRPELAAAAQEALPRWGFGLSSVRFICGTQDVHAELEARLARFLGFEDAILFSSCFDANGGVFEALLGEEDAVVSDALNHASIIDGIRLCKARRYRYANGDMADLASQLDQARADGARFTLVVTDGVFSMDGYLAKLPAICDLAERHGALVMVDDSHAVGFVGGRAAGPRALRGAGAGGDSSPARSARHWVAPPAATRADRRRSSPGSGSVPVRTFLDSLAPTIVATSMRALDLIENGADFARSPHRQRRLLPISHERCRLPSRRRQPSDHSRDARRRELAGEWPNRMLALGVYVAAFSFPVVPRGEARVRTQMSAAHTKVTSTRPSGRSSRLAGTSRWSGESDHQAECRSRP